MLKDTCPHPVRSPGTLADPECTHLARTLLYPVQTCGSPLFRFWVRVDSTQSPSTLKTHNDYLSLSSLMCLIFFLY